MKGLFLAIIMAFVVIAMFFSGCKPKGGISSLTSDAASKVYVPPGSYDEFYLFTSGGFSGQLGYTVFHPDVCFGRYPSSPLTRRKDTASARKPRPCWKHPLDSYPGMIHITLSFRRPMAKWMEDGYLSMRTIRQGSQGGPYHIHYRRDHRTPNTGGNHASAFITDNNEYVVSASRFSIPMGQREAAIDSYKEEFDGVATFISVDPKSGNDEPGIPAHSSPFDYDLAHTGKGPSSGWMFLPVTTARKPIRCWK